MSLIDQQKSAPPEIRTLANFLRGKAGLKLRPGVLNGKRVDYFKGSSAVKSLQSPAYAKLKNVPKVSNDAEAITFLNKSIRYAFFLRIDRGESITPTLSGPAGTAKPKKAKVVHINQMQLFAPDHYYAWFYEGPQWRTYVGGALMVFIVLAGVMFPLWPPMFRQGVSYLSMGVLGLIGLFFVIAIIRLIFWLITIVAVPPGIWIFPQLFADVGFVDSFIPAWDWDIKKKKKKKGEKNTTSEKSSKDTKSSNGPNLSVPKAGSLVSDSDTSRPSSRSARIEEVEDEDD